MGFRASFLKHTGYVTCHSEVFLHVLNKFDVHAPMSVLLIGVGNGGSLQIWRDMLPEGSVVIGIDENPDCASLDLDIHCGPINDRAWLERVLAATMFDMIIDSTGEASGATWPWLKVGGFLIMEPYDDVKVRELMDAITSDTYTWLPYEEILGVIYQPKVVMVEKRNPRVVPYLDIVVGVGDPIVAESVFTDAGAKRVTVPAEVLEKL